MLWTVLSAVVFIFWSYALILIWRSRNTTPFLCDQPESILRPPASHDRDSWSKVRIVAAARNEEKSIEEAVQSWIDIDYPNLEVVVINDRSTDKTADILACLENRFPFLKVYHISELPEGWLGKNHALHMGASDAASGWILFTDADVKFHPKAIKKAISFAEEHHLDHLTCTPGTTGGTWASRGLLCNFATFLLLYFHSQGSPGIGAFNLVRTSVYKQIGGHKRIALCTDDDSKLGKLIKLNGSRQMLLHGKGMISVPWYSSVPVAARALEKNAFTALEYSLVRAFFMLTGLSIVFFVPYIGLLFSSGFPSILSSLSVAAQIAIFSYMGRLTATPLTAALAIPLNAMSLAYCMVRSVYFAKKRNGIIWRDSFYPLKELREKGRI